MIRRGFGSAGRLAAVALAVALVLSLAGDRGRAATVPAVINGQDPLEVLALKVRPNVIVVLDTSGSMTRQVTNQETLSGDHPLSRMHVAKQVLKQVITDNQDKASFMLGTYTQFSVNLQQQQAGRNRFQYSAASDMWPNMLTDELWVKDPPGETSNRGLQSWQIIYDQWKTLYFGESSGTVCSATLPGPFPKFYRNGSDLALDLQNAMNASPCANTYTVTYDTGTGRFTFEATGANSFSLRPADTPNNIANALGGLPTTVGGMGTITPFVTSLERRNGHTRVQVSGAHGVSVGDTCTITGATASFFNGTWSVISIQSSSEFRLNGPTGSTQQATNVGTMTCMAGGGGVVQSNAPYTLLYRVTSGTANNLAQPFRDGMDTIFTFTDIVNGVNVTSYQLASSRIWNGEIVKVQADGTICDVDFTTNPKTSPPSVTVQRVTSGCGTDETGQSARFDWAGGRWGGNNFCRGFRGKMPLIPCDLQSPPAPLQITMALPYLDTELPFDANGDPADWSGDGNPDYVEAMDGSWAVQTVNVAPSAKASGSTPLGNSLIDIKGAATGSGCIVNPPPLPGEPDLSSQAAQVGACEKRNFTELWEDGQTGTTDMAGPGPWQLDPVSTHLDPKEKTIVLFVTDGNDTCDVRTSALGETDLNALRAAHKAEQLYERLDGLQPASSVQTFVIGFGGAFTGGEPTRLNWIAWGGSGLGNDGQPDVPTTDSGEAERWHPTGCNISYSNTNNTTCVNNYLKGRRAGCSTCQDAFVAPDAATLAAQLQAIIDQGASEGEFNAQQSITESVFEYVDRATTSTDVYESAAPANRYQAIVPTRVLSTFTLPGFQGQVKAYQDDGTGTGTAVVQWSAGDVLWRQVSQGMINDADCNPNGTTGAADGECSFQNLHAGATDAGIATSGAAIKRRVYTTSRNGVYTFTPGNLVAYGTGSWTPPERVSLWPPASGVAPGDYVTPGLFDAEMGLPLDGTTDAAADLASLQADFGACVGNNLPGACTAGGTLDQMKAARREAREMILAFMAGAQTVEDGSGPKRAQASSGGVPQGALLYTARSWMLADSELATAAIVTQPLPAEPDSFLQEYSLFRDGPRDGNGKNTSSSSADQVYQGFGLRNPDNDGEVGITTDTSVTPNVHTGVPDSRTELKPVMTVVYVPANDMLHAFRAGPNVSPSTSCDEVASPATDECGGQELWGFVPYDQLSALRLRLVNDPQGQNNHVFMLARGVRFSDVFVSSDTPITVNPDGVASSTLEGVWRRILYVPRGIGGKYMTALDITAPGPYTVKALDTQGPVPLWSRGNPDTDDGTGSGTDNNTAADRLAYATMGETWSIPAIAYVDRTQAIYQTARNPAGLDYVIYLGSGYGAAGEGTTFYTLDALSGDVVASVDVELAAAANGLTRGGLPYPNAIVANVVGFNPSAYALLSTVHPAASKVTRVYFGDLHGRLWKVLAAAPDVAIPIADLGADQPVGTAASLIGMPPQPDVPVPHVYVTSGNERRAEGPFGIFGFRDDGGDTETALGGSTTEAGVTTFAPAVLLRDPDDNPFVREFDQGLPDADCGYTVEAVFRGTVQPTTVFEESPTGLLGRVFFAGTRLSLPNTVFAPPTPLACGTGDYPCRSTFDSIIYALGAKTGVAAYDLNSAGDDAYRIYRDSRIAAITMLADPDPARGGSSFTPDEGQMEGTPKPPPPPGVPPTGVTATANVVMVREPGKPPPSVRYGSTVCQ